MDTGTGVGAMHIYGRVISLATSSVLLPEAIRGFKELRRAAATTIRFEQRKFKVTIPNLTSHRGKSEPK